MNRQSEVCLRRGKSAYRQPVGYRVNSKRGVLFRKWATQLLKDYLIKGYSINRQRLQKQAEQLNELKEAIKILGTTLEYKKLTSDESTGLLKIISDYSYALEILDQYDYQTLMAKMHTATCCTIERIVLYKHPFVIELFPAIL